MNDLPLHPSLVHIPIGLCMALPIVIFFIIIGIRQGWFQPKTWLVIILLQGLCFGSAIIAKNAGENEEDKVEKIVGEHALEKHEERAESFVIFSGILFVLTFAGLSSRAPIQKWGQILTLAGSLGTLGLAIFTGHSGGELVYEHGAAKAYLQDAPAATDSPQHEEESEDE